MDCCSGSIWHQALYFHEADGYLYLVSEIKCFLADPNFKAKEMRKPFISIWPFKCVWMMNLFEGVRKSYPAITSMVPAKILQNICFWDTNYVIDDNHNEEYFLRK